MPAQVIAPLEPGATSAGNSAYLKSQAAAAAQNNLINSTKGGRTRTKTSTKRHARQTKSKCQCQCRCRHCRKCCFATQTKKNKKRRRGGATNPQIVVPPVPAGSVNKSQLENTYAAVTSVSETQTAQSQFDSAAKK